MHYINRHPVVERDHEKKRITIERPIASYEGIRRAKRAAQEVKRKLYTKKKHLSTCNRAFSNLDKIQRSQNRAHHESKPSKLRRSNRRARASLLRRRSGARSGRGSGGRDRSRYVSVREAPDLKSSNDGIIAVLDNLLNLQVVDGDELSVLRALDTGLDERGEAVVGWVGDLGEVVGEPLVLDEGGHALGEGRCGGGGGGALEIGDVELGELSLEVIVVDLELCGAIRVQDNEAEVVLLLGVLVDDTAAEVGVHLGAVERGGLVEDSGTDLAAAVLGHEDWDAAILEHVHEFVVTGLVEGGWATPGVTVESEDIGD